jgi:hypothetical protein
MDRDVVAKRLKGLPREGIGLAFDLLQADDIGLALAKPCDDAIEALPDGIYVPSGYSHGLRLKRRQTCRIRGNKRRDMPCAAFIC